MENFKKSDWKVIFQYSIAALITLGFIALVFLMVLRVVPETNNTLLNVMVGTFGTMAVGVNSYLFGSTKSSSDKNAMLFNSAPLSKENEN
jgi:uncharacterized BrkB/YihY/UPF0761 family membrane protein